MGFPVPRPRVPWLLAVGIVAAVAGPAHAQPTSAGRLLLDWNAPADCPTSADLHSAVARLLGGTVYISAGRTVDVHAVVTHGPRWQVALEDGAGPERHQRVLEAASCAELAEATALIVALLIDAKTVTTVPIPASPPPTVEASPPVARDATVSSFRLGVHGAAGLGILPGLDAGLGGSLALVRGAWRFDLRASYGLRRDQTATAATPTGAYGQFNYTGGAVGVCRVVARTWFELGGCLDAELGVLTAHGHNVTDEQQASTPWLGLGPAGLVAIRAGRRISFPVRAALLVPVLRPEFVFDHVDGSVFRVAPVRVSLSLGAELHF